MDIVISPIFLATLPVVMGLVSVAKMFTASKWAPLVALALGIGAGFLVTDVSWQQTVISGLALGLMSAGLWSGARSVTQ